MSINRGKGFLKNNEYYKKLKVNTSDVRGIVFAFDMMMENESRNADKSFDEVVTVTHDVKHLINSLSELITDIEADQYDLGHFKRVVHYEAKLNSYVSEIKSYVEEIENHKNKYLSSCEKVRDLSLIHI
jgi:hypothetical protein